MSEQNELHRVTVSRANNLPRGYTNLSQNQLDSNNRVSSSRQVISSSRTTGHQGQIHNTSSHYVSTSRAGSRRVIEGAGNFDLELGNYVEQLIVSGDTDFATLRNMKDSMMTLSKQFEQNGAFKFEGAFKENFQQRLLMLEHDFDGLMRRFINLKYMYPNGENRNIDYSKFLSEKETMISDLQRKIARMYDNNKPFQQENLALKEQNQRLTEVINKQSQYIEDLSRDFQSKQGFSGLEGIDRYLASLEKQISQLKGRGGNMKSMEDMVTGWIEGLPQHSQLKRIIEFGSLRQKEDQHYLSMKAKLEDAQSLFKSQMQQLRYTHPHLNLPFESKILDLLASNTTKVGRVDAQGYYQVEKEVRVEREIPIQDQRTRAMIRVLGHFVKRILSKYPKLKSEVDVNVQEYLNDSLFDTIVSDDLDRLISITRIVPQMVKVENVYTHSSEKQRKVEFHLRVLIKALLEEFSKAKAKGYDLQIDEGVIGMVRSEVMDLVDLDDILAVFRPLPRIVEVPKVVEKVVESIVPIPHRFELHHKTADVTGLQKQVIAQDSIGVPMESQYGVPMIQEVAVPIDNYVEKIVKHTQKEEIPFTTTVYRDQVQTHDRYREKPVPGNEKQVVYQKERIVKERDNQIYEVNKNIRQICEVIHQDIQPVEHIIEKIVEKIVTIEKAVPVQVIKQILVKQIEHRIVKEEVPYAVHQIKIQKEIHEKLIEAIQTRQVLKPEPYFVEKIVEVPEIQEVVKYEYIRDPVVVEKVVTEEVVVHRDKVVERVVQSVKSVDRIVEKPLFKEIVKVVNQIEQVPFVDEIIKETHKPIEIRVDVPIIHERPVQIPVSYPVYLKEEVPVFIKEENTYPYPVYYQRIKPEIQIVEKIVEKIVQVPRTIEIQKIVQKIVIVPRIVEKIVEVPQIVQRIVEKEVQKIREAPPIERTRDVPIYRDRPVEITQEKIVTIIQQVEKILTKEIPLIDTVVEIRNQFETIFKDKIVQVIEEVPVNIREEIHLRDGWEEIIKEVPVQRQVLYPVEVPVPIRIEVDKPIQVNREVTHVLPVPHAIERIVPEVCEKVIFQPVDRIVERVVVKPEVQIMQVEKIVVDTEVQSYETIREKIVEVQTTSERIKEVPVVMENIVKAIHQRAKVFEYAGEKEIIEGPLRVEVIKEMEPLFLNINRYIETIVDKIVEVPYLIQQCIPGQTLNREVLVAGPERHTQSIKEVQLKAEKELIREVMKTVQERVNVIEENLKIACERIETPSDPVIITKDRLVEMPMILEKIVEKITVMPQVHEILKYVHELVEEDNITALSDLTVEVQQYKEKSTYLDNNMGSFIESLKKLKSSSASQNLDINGMIEYCQKFRHYLQHPKLFERIVNQPVEKQIVRVPREKSAEESREELARVLLIEELLGALTRLKTEQRIPIENYLSEDVMSMFSFVFEGSLKIVGEAFKNQMKKFQSSVLNKFTRLGGWSVDHNMMLKSFIDERFELATGIKSLKKDNERLKNSTTQMEGKYNNTKSQLLAAQELIEEQQRFIDRIIKLIQQSKDRNLTNEYESLLAKYKEFHIVFKAYYQSDFARKFNVTDKELDYFRNSKIRELTETILRLERQIREMGRENDVTHWNEALRLENDQLMAKITILKEEIHVMKEQYKPNSANSNVPELLEEIARLKERIYYLEQQISHGTKYRDVYEAQTSINSNTNLSPRRYDRHTRPESESDGGYGANFGQYMNNDPSGLGMIESRKNVYQSSVSNKGGNLTNSAATYRTNNNDFSSAKHLGGATYGTKNLESSQVNRYQGQNEGGITASFKQNNVQMTTSRVETEHRIQESGQMTLNKPIARTQATTAIHRSGQGQTTTRGLESTRNDNTSSQGSTNKYQYYNSKYTGGQNQQ